ncbi:hypothetical protein Rsub_03907 [Raphidocelis subcapitata]|uniref:Uncharacterized protein n=1 Tax=Raphidocelis subcapitata TaxID=307507 RepID=A0A2V0NTT4_9CHLO|nr:hypothetical protein Rsub_03907 [Raphidocelis subcapitata]|eukprot:GBF91051.1 hypothetical protein Rsub_03907 [Raphidocelis subcapitata]
MTARAAFRRLGTQLRGLAAAAEAPKGSGGAFRATSQPQGAQRSSVMGLLAGEGGQSSRPASALARSRQQLRRGALPPLAARGPLALARALAARGLVFSGQDDDGT